MHALTSSALLDDYDNRLVYTMSILCLLLTMASMSDYLTETFTVDYRLGLHVNLPRHLHHDLNYLPLLLLGMVI